jgi:hypothetical protein
MASSSATQTLFSPTLKSQTMPSQGSLFVTKPILLSQTVLSKTGRTLARWFTTTEKEYSITQLFQAFFLPFFSLPIFHTLLFFILLLPLLHIPIFVVYSIFFLRQRHAWD